jgi:mRNA interferase HigB
MHVISRKPLREFYAKKSRAKQPLNAWFTRATKAKWTKFADVRADYNSADAVGKFVVFDVGGNKYRLIATIHYDRNTVFIRHVLTHAEYEEGDWQNE